METKKELSSNEYSEITLSFNGNEKWSCTGDIVQEETGINDGRNK